MVAMYFFSMAIVDSIYIGSMVVLLFGSMAIADSIFIGSMAVCQYGNSSVHIYWQYGSNAWDKPPHK